MAATIRGTFLLIDKASDTLRRIEAQALRTQAAVDGVGTALDKHEQSQRRSSAALAKESQTLRTFEGDLRRTRSEVHSTTQAQQQFTRATSTAGRGVSDVGQKARKATDDLRRLRQEQNRFGRIARGVGGALIGGTLGFLAGGPVGAGAGAAVGQAAGKSSAAGFLFTKDAVKQLDSAFQSLGKAAGVVGNAFKFLKLADLVTGIQPALGAVSSLGGLIAGMLPRLAQLGNAFYALPGAMVAGAQAMGTFGLAMKGVMAAVGQAIQMQNQWSYNQQQWSQQVVDAQNAVVVSQNGLTNAIWSQNQAQIQLTIARRDASRELTDMEFAARSAVLQETQAGLTVMQARMNLQQALSTAGTTQLQISQARLGVEQAILGQQNQQVTTTRAQVDLHRAQRRDPTSQVTQQVAQAQHQAAQSIFETAQAEKSLVRSQWELNHLYVTGNSGLAGYRQALRALEPAQRQFVKFLTGPLSGRDPHSFLNEFQRMQNQAAAGLFPGIERGLTRLRGSFSTIDGVLRKTGQALGGTIDKVLGRLADPKWIGQVGAANASMIGTVGDGVVHLTGVFKDLVTAAEPFLKWVAGAFDRWAKAEDKLYGSQKGRDMMAQRFRLLERAIRTVVHIAKDLWDILRNVGKAADQALGKQLWGGATKGLDAWAKWTGSVRGQKDMRKYFHDMLPTLRAFKGLVEALAKALVQLTGPAGQAGGTHLLQNLTGLVGPLKTVLTSMAQDAGPFQTISRAFASIVASMSKIGPLRHVLEGAFALTLVVRFVKNLGEGVSHMSRLVGLFGKFNAENKRSGMGGMASPGTGGFFSRLWQRVRHPLSAGTSVTPFGSAANAFRLSAEWGIRSEAGPGSMSNPLAVVTVGGGSGLGGGGGYNQRFQLPGGRTQKEIDAARRAEQAVSGASRFEKLGAILSGVPLVGRFASKLPGALGRGAGLAGDVAAAGGELRGGLGVLGKVGLGMAKFLPGIGALATVLPGVIGFFSAKGGFENKLAAGANSIVSGATFGLVNNLFGGAVSKSQQQRQGQAGADKFLRRPGVINPVTGMPDLSRIDVRLGNQWQQYRDAKNGRIGRFGAVIGRDPGKAAREAASIKQLNIDTANASAGAWQNAFTQGLTGPNPKPQQAMKTMIAGLSGQLQDLGGSGQKQLMQNMVQWGAGIVQQNPQLKGPIGDLNSWIENRFQTMGQNVQIVNGQILTGSKAQWGGIYTAMTNPMDKALEKLNGTFGKIQQAAIGELMTMGLKRQDATMLLKNPASANQWMNWAQTGQPGGAAAPRGGIGNRKASGGRVMGSDRRDVYQFGGNVLGGGELVMNRWQEADANARLMRHGEPSVGSIVSNKPIPHWAYATGGRARRASGGYALPLPRGMMGGSWSIDQGVDINGGTSAIANQPLFAVGPGKIIQEGISGFGPNAPVLHLDQPVMGHSNVYYGHAGADTVGIGTHVGAGQQISRVGAGRVGLSSGPHLEIGFGPPFSTGGDMSTFLHQLLGGKTVSQTSMTGGVGTGLSARERKPIKLRVPAFGGIGGVPQVLAGRAASAFAHTLQSGLNAGMNASGGGLSGNFTGGGNARQNEALGRRMMLAAGWPASQWPSLLKLWTQESSWSTTAANPSGAYGIPQSLPGSKMASAGSDWRTNPATQIKWGLDYIRGRYGSPAGAEAHEIANSWYDTGGRVRDAGWFRNGGSFVTSGPTVFGAGEGGVSERVTVEKAGAGSTRPVHIEIHHIEVNREGDVRRVVDEELQLLAKHMGSVS